MIRLAANLHTMFTEVAPLDRFAWSRQAGFRGVELFLPYHLRPCEVRARLDEHGLEVVQLYLPCGDFDAGERGIAILADRTDEFRRSVRAGADYAAAIGCPTLNCLAGIGAPGADSSRYRQTLVENLRNAARTLADEGLQLLIEPISNQGPHYFVRYTPEARGLIDDVAEPNLGLLLDLYHTQILEGNLAHTLTEQFDVLRHVQVADVPGRHEPGTGEINYAFLFSLLEQHGYDGWVGCEYLPNGRTLDGLAWAAPYLESSASTAR